MHQTSKGLKQGLTLSLPYHLCAFPISLTLWPLGCPAGWTDELRLSLIYCDNHSRHGLPKRGNTETSIICHGPFVQLWWSPLLLSRAFPSKQGIVALPDFHRHWEEGETHASQGGVQTLDNRSQADIQERENFHPRSALNIKKKSPWMLIYSIRIYSPLLFSVSCDNIN